MKKKIYDNSNIAESYAGVTTPLTFSFARYVYQEVYQHFSKMMGASNKTIRENISTFEHMIEFIGYRIYYNLNSWYTMLSFFPAYKLSSEFMEKMMGVEKHNVSEVELNYRFFQKYFFYLPKTTLRAIRILLTFSSLGWRMERFNRYFELVFFKLNSIDLDKLNLSELKDLFAETDAKLLARWRVPIANDFAVMVSTGLADKLFKKWLASNEAYSYMAMTINGPLISLDPGSRLIQIAKHIQQDEEVKELFLGQHSENEILQLLYKRFTTHQVTKGIESYLNEFGVRMPNELKLESETLIENPQNFISIIRRLIKIENIKEESSNTQFESVDFKNLNLIQKIFLKWLLRWAGSSIHRREEARFYRTLIFGYVRKIFLEIGKKMEQSKILKNQRDIFYLTIEEVFNIIGNKRLTLNPISVIEQRKSEYAKWQNIELPRRIETFQDIHEIELELLSQTGVSKKREPDKLMGLVASCPNKMQIFSGVALTLKSFDPAADFAGKILVTCQTDPGWTIIFPLLEGVIVERGGMLSHAAIVARELNIPCIVGVEHATETITSGMNIKLDLQNGLIQKI